MGGCGGPDAPAVSELTHQVVLTPEADLELNDAADWYEQKARLGAEFVTQVREVLNRIGRMPELYAVVHRNVRRARVRRFSYNIYYRLQNDRVEVIAILHAHRDPAARKNRT